MLRYALRRLLFFPLVLLAMYSGAVGLLMFTPGQGLESGEKELPPEVLAQRLKAYNYDEPWWQRYYWTWPKRLVWDRDLPAHQYEDWTVVEIMSAALPVSLQLGVIALGLAMLIGFSAGALAVVGGIPLLDRLTLLLALLGISVPTFVVGALLVMVFGIWLQGFPVGGWGRPSQTLLPAFTLALPYAAYIARLTRSALLDVYDQDFIRTARAKGLSTARVFFDHALRNAFLPVLGYLGPAAAAIFTGSFVVEKIFVIPGMGTHVVESIHNRDQSLILATVLVYGTFLVLFNLIVDLLYGVIDPRVRVDEGVST